MLEGIFSGVKTEILITHVVAGSLCLLVGFIVLVLPKGTALHKSAGSVYFIGQIATVVSAILLSLIKPDYFLTMLAFFSFYMAYSGKRMLRGFRRGSIVTSIPDNLINLIGFAMSIYVFFLSVYNTDTGQIEINIVGIFFSLLFPVLVIRGFRYYNNSDLHRQHYLHRHIGMMVGSYIATVTAFVVVNNLAPYAWLNWLVPTFVGAGIIVLFIVRAKRTVYTPDELN